jgi:hypothetical protein
MGGASGNTNHVHGEERTSQDFGRIDRQNGGTAGYNLKRFIFAHGEERSL